MPDWSLSGWTEPDEYARMRRYFGLVVGPIIEMVKDCDDHPDALFAAKYLIDKVVWGVTTCVDKHKLNLRYISEGAKGVFAKLGSASVSAAEKNSLRKTLRHEHVVPRRLMIQKLMGADPAVLTEAVACVVTIDEHAQLGDGAGWERYWTAKIRVWDRATGHWLKEPPIGTSDEPTNTHDDDIELIRSVRLDDQPASLPVPMGGGRSSIIEADILTALKAVNLHPNKDAAGWRGADGTVGQRYVWWPKTQRGAIGTLHLGRFRADTPLTRPIENGNVRFEIPFRGVPRSTALAALHEAVRLLVQKS